MKPAPFDYHAPASLAEALELLGRFGDEAKVLAGGQSLIPILAMRLSRFEHLVDLRKIEELRRIDRNDGTVRIGAMTTQATVERSKDIAADLPLLAQATKLIGHFQIRSRGTLGGSIAHADPAAEYPAMASVLDAELEVAGPNGTRSIPSGEFFTGTWMTTLEPEEILVAARFTPWRGQCGFAVREVARRHGDFAMAGVACGVEVADGRVARAAIGFFGMGSTPVRATATEQALTGSAVDDMNTDELGHLAVGHLDPPSDVHASGAHRKRIGAAITQLALATAISEAQRA
jgi:aerobic carbon-monoxide dehydrogenase medium subunit